MPDWGLCQIKKGDLAIQDGQKCIKQGGSCGSPCSGSRAMGSLRLGLLTPFDPEASVTVSVGPGLHILEKWQIKKGNLS